MRAISGRKSFVLTATIVSLLLSLMYDGVNFALFQLPGDLSIRLAALSGSAVLIGNVAVLALANVTICVISLLIRIPSAPLSPVAKTSRRQLVAGALAGLLYICIILFADLCSSVSIVGQSATSLILGVGLPSRIALTAAAALIVAVSEEYIFRQRMLSAAKTLGWSPFQSSVFTSALFAGAHPSLTLDERFSLFLLGLVLAYAFLRGGGWAMAASLHFAQDFMGFLANPDRLRAVHFPVPLPWANIWIVSDHAGFTLAGTLVVVVPMVVVTELSVRAFRLSRAAKASQLAE